MPSSKSKLSAFPVTTTGYPCFPYGPQRLQFSEISSAAYALTTPGFTPSLTAKLAGSLQAGWLCPPGGTRSLSLTHPLGNIN